MGRCGAVVTTSKTKGRSPKTQDHFFFLNILSIRSVITNPPTTFVVEHTTAIKPRIVATLLWPEPAITIEPTREIPEIAFVADINGVCSNGGTREMTW